MKAGERRGQQALQQQLKLSRNEFQRAARAAKERPSGDPVVRRQLRDLRGDVRGVARPAPPPPVRRDRSTRDWSSIDEVVYRAATVIGLVLGALTAVVLTAGHLTARVFDGAWPSYGWEEIPGIAVRVVRNLGDPAVAWEPVNSGGQPPGAVAFWLVVLALLALLFIGIVLLLARRRRRDLAPEYLPDDADDEPSGDDSSGGGFAGLADRPRWQAGRGRDTAPADGPALLVGYEGRRPVTLDPLHSLLVVGPAHTGKSTGIAIPTLLEWQGPVLAASTSSHLLDTTIGWRRRMGETHVFDPAGVTGHRPAGWSPLADAGTWEGAIRTAQHLTAAARSSVVQASGVAGGGLDGGSLSGRAMAMSLAPFLSAAAAGGRSVMETAEWIEREERDEVVEILQTVDEHAAHVHDTSFSRADPARSAFFHTMYQVLSVYSDPAVASTAKRHDIAAEDLIVAGQGAAGRGRTATVYLTAPEHDHSRFQPLFATIVRQVVAAVNERFAATSGQPLRPPLLVLLDEAMGAAALQALAELASTGVTKGVQVVSIFEDLDRLQGLPGDVPDLLVRSHRAKLVLPGTQGSATGLVPPGLLDELGDGEGGGSLSTTSR
jgi:type IV secretion system protein VirD4